MTDTSAIPAFPMPRAAGCPFEPPPGMRALQDDKPLARVRIWDGGTPWLVTGHAEQRALLADPRVSADERRPGFPHQERGMAETVEHRPPSIFNSDGPEHKRFRRMMQYPFTFKRVAALRPTIQRLTDDLVTTLLAGPGPADLVQALALPLPSQMICALLGVPYEDHAFFQRNSLVGVDRHATPEENAQSAGALVEYLARLIAARLESPPEDAGFVDDLAGRVRAGEATVPEAAMMGVVLLIAGHETSANMIALGTLALLQNPGQFAVFRDAGDPKAVAAAVEEMLRYLSIVQFGLRRVALEDIEIAGETIRAGEGIIVAVSAANWDPAVFPEPGRLDLGRDARMHNAFGFGVHQCVGQQLARAELQIVYETLCTRIPTLALAVPADQVEFKHDNLAYGVWALPVTWG